MSENGVTTQESAQTETVQTPRVKKKRGDFRFGPTLGEGSYSTVILAREIASGREFAMKVLEKRHIMREKKVPQVEREKQVLSRLDHPFFVRLYFTFQDSERLYFGLSVARKGELLSKIKQLGKFDMECARFYTAQIVSALQHLHSLNIIHRDLKPENILFNDKMQIQITDFGTAKQLSDSGDEPRSSSFVGTAQYVSPELLKDKKACKSSDLWALGCIVYQMLTGEFPFKAPNEYLIFQQIVNCKYEFPENFDRDAKNLISSLLQLNPMERLGSASCGGYERLMEHPFFSGIDWENLANQPAPKTMLALAGDSSDEDTVEDLADGFDQAFINDFKNQVVEESKVKGDSSQLATSDPTDISGYGLPAVMGKEDRERWLRKQQSSEWDYFAKGNLILKQGQLEKKRGFSVKLREFLLTEGPKLIYIDPNSKEVKGEIPWSSELRTEPKSFRIFLVHTPNRTYHLIDKSNNALMWCKKIEEIKKHYFKDGNH
uniref:3-phosphoinositide-dependent protein kinase 1 n=1 Tax=Ciona intestinalis TaxID=7719 RepID=UPI000180C02E|nr:3-phosphoinositide-dependent protein kinase 1 [Ciona intestinalis]|eukprot:XP_002124476.1 3-phosphoinositide-dependent protein kinase 1 [Ciona intestinalis]